MKLHALEKGSYLDGLARKVVENGWAVPGYFEFLVPKDAETGSESESESEHEHEHEREGSAGTEEAELREPEWDFQIRKRMIYISPDVVTPEVWRNLLNDLHRAVKRGEVQREEVPLDCFAEAQVQTSPEAEAA